MARLIMRRGPNAGIVYPLNNDIVTIGRGSKNDIIIQDNEVSRQHCRITWGDGRYQILDLHSSNGTYVNGIPATQALTLLPGALIELGDSVTLEFDGDQPPATTFAMPNATQERTIAATPPAHYSLMVLDGPEVGRVYELSGATITIGRDLSNDIIIQTPAVSRFHARLRREGASFVLEDLGSTNGTCLDDAEIKAGAPATLVDGAIISLGSNVRLQVVTGTEAAVARKTSSALPAASRSLTTFFEDTASDLLPGTLQAAEKAGESEPDAAPLDDHILIVYARDDWNRFVSALVQHLRAAGFKVWVDQHLIYGTPAWRAAMEKALRECWLMVVVLSPHSLPLNYIRLSYRTFLNLKKPVMPLVYEPTVTLPLELAKRRLIIHDRKHPHRSMQALILEIQELRRLNRS